MNLDPQVPLANQMNVGREAIEAELDALSDFIATHPEPAVFYEALLAAANRLWQSAGACVWSVDGNQYRLLAEAHSHAWGREQHQQVRSMHEAALTTVLTSRGPAPTRFENVQLADRSERTFHARLYPFRQREQIFAILEIIHSQELPAQSFDALAAAFEELAVDYARNHALKVLTTNREDWETSLLYARSVHQSLNLQDTCFTIVNECRRLLDCDRVSIASYVSSRSRMIAMSGAGQIERRALQVNRLEQLFDAVARSGQRLETSQIDRELAPQIQQALDSYLDAAPTRWITIIPLTNSNDAEEPRVIALLCWERFSEIIPTAKESRRTWLVEHATSAYRNAYEYSSLPLLTTSRGLRAFLQRLFFSRARAWSLGLACMALAAALGFLIPVDFSITATGTLQPVNLRHLFAPVSGEVKEVSVEHGQLVKSGERLITLESHELNLAYQRVFGEHQATQEKLTVLEAVRLGERSKPSESGVTREQMDASSERELRELLQSQDEQLRILEKALADLSIVSPIEGTITTWDVRRRLLEQPVAQGAWMLSVADLNGDWEIQLDISEAEAGYVRDAAAEFQKHLSVSFAPDASPSQTFQADLLQISTTADYNRAQAAVVRAVASVQRGQSLQPQAGAIVSAKIHCGRRSIFFVWFRELYEAIYRYVL